MGRSSNRAKPKKVRTKVMRLIRAKYSGEVCERFGPTLACEHRQSEDAIDLHPTTVKRWMVAEELWSRERKTQQHRKRRDRGEHFGELVQLDGSFHEWLEKRGPRGCLMNLEDDATSTTLCRRGEQENDLGRGGCVASGDGRVWRAQGAVHGLEECLVREPTVNASIKHRRRAGTTLPKSRVTVCEWEDKTSRSTTG
ncbi:MAG: hypothetical protein ABI811_11375 [Acidobacteriota bacterium]